MTITWIAKQQFMGSQIGTSVTFNLPDGQEVKIETGKLATQAHGSVVITIGKTMLFCSVVSAFEAREGQSFFPLSVDYQEKFASVGRIPGNFFRREARLSDYEILICRLVDRAIRPLFPDGYMHDTQVIINLWSGEEDVLPDAYAALAASAALAVSNINFAGPLSEVRVAKIDGAFVVNPSRSALETAELEVIVAATMDNVMMVEGEAQECSEADLIEAIKVGHDAIKVQCQAQLDLAAKVGEKATVKRVLEEAPENEDLKAKIKELIHESTLEVSRGALNKSARKDGFKAIKEALKEQLLEAYGEEYMDENGHFVSGYFKKIQKETIREMVLSEGVRLDGRKYDQVRPIWTEVDYLPSAHGSAIFNRGETQAIATLTLGTKMDEQMIDNALLNERSRFILHYNFPAFSVGETKPMRGPGRREVGHANLAARSLKKVLPEDNSYTLRIVSDILESNGSSSMATVCAGSLAMMDAGLKIKAPVSGIAMGMISDGDRSAILSDILGDEDALGDMDFKLTGTAKGITACQMDIKIDGLPYETLEKALEQAKEGRLHIIGEMNKTLAQANDELKPHAPRVTEMIVDKEFIGAIIGPGGKVIQELQKTTGASINIEEVGEKGIVNIFTSEAKAMEEAMAAIQRITHVVQAGDEYDATVSSIKDYGVFVDFMNSGGLVHISEIEHRRLNSLEGMFKEGDIMRIKVVGKDPKTRKWRLSRKALLPRPDKN